MSEKFTVFHTFWAWLFISDKTQSLHVAMCQDVSITIENCFASFKSPTSQTAIQSVVCNVLVNLFISTAEHLLPPILKIRLDGDVTQKCMRIT